MHFRDPVYDIVMCAKLKKPYGFFMDDPIGFAYALKIGKFQIRKYENYKIIPIGYYFYLKGTGIFRRSFKIPSWNTTYGDLLGFLMDPNNYETREARAAGEYLFEQILVARHCELKNHFASAQVLHEKGEFSRIYLPGKR